MKAFRSLLGLFVRKNMVIREFAAWLCAAVLLPIIAPVFIASLCIFIAAFVGQVDISFFDNMFGVFLEKGVYAFVGMTILLSLFQDGKVAVQVIKGVVGVFWIVLLLLLGLLFIDSLGLIEGDTTFLPSFKSKAFIYLSSFSVIFAAVLKLKIINHKIKELYRL